MCTALIYRDPTRNLYGLGFNRDESVKRKPSLSPILLESTSGKAIAPIDGDAGGTWIGISRDGEIICLLNYYEATLKLLRNPTSRGLLVRSILLKERTPESYPFRNSGSTILLNYSGFDGMKLIFLFGIAKRMKPKKIRASIRCSEVLSRRVQKRR